MSTVAVSVIVPVLNAEKTLARCLRSVLDAIPTNGEVIVVDNGSVDSSRTIARRVACADRRVQLAHARERGVSKARNVGLGCAQGRIIAFCDADDEWLPNAYTVIRRGVDAGCECVIAGGVAVGDAPGWVSPSLTPPAWLAAGPTGPETVFRKGCKPFLQRFAVKAHIASCIDFDESVTIGEDMAFMLECCLVADDVYVASEPVFRYNWSDGAMSSVAGMSLAPEHLRVVERVCSNDDIARRLRKDTFLRHELATWAVKYVGRHADSAGSPTERASLLTALKHVGADDETLSKTLSSVDAGLRRWLECAI